jgi:hypothetical protein
MQISENRGFLDTIKIWQCLELVQILVKTFYRFILAHTCLSESLIV